MSLTRRISITINGVVIPPALTVDFTVAQSEDKTPNTLQLKVIGLSQRTFNRVAKDRGLVELSAGNDKMFGLLYKGGLRSASWNKEEGVGMVATFKAGDGDEVHTKASVNKSFPKGVSVNTMVEEIAKTIPNTEVNPLDISTQSYSRPLVISGNTDMKLDQFASQYGFNWGVFDGVFKANVKGVQSKGYITLLSPTTGLIGIPTHEEEGKLSIKSLLNPNLKPFEMVQVQTRNGQRKFDSFSEGVASNGTYKILEVSHTGTNRGQAFYSEITKGEYYAN